MIISIILALSKNKDYDIYYILYIVALFRPAWWLFLVTLPLDQVLGPQLSTSIWRIGYIFVLIRMSVIGLP